MNKRLRKKALKKTGKYVNPKEVWNLDYTISEWIVPRLKLFKERKHSYPCNLTSEEWDVILDKIILAFELGGQDPLDLYDDIFWKDMNKYNKKVEEDYIAKINEGLDLFKEYYLDLWD